MAPHADSQPVYHSKFIVPAMCIALPLPYLPPAPPLPPSPPGERVLSEWEVFSVPPMAQPHSILWCVPIRFTLERNQQSKKYLNNENTVCGDFAIAQIIVRLDASAAATEMHKVQPDRFTSQWSPSFLPFSLRFYLCGRGAFGKCFMGQSITR